jgi:hypothetical protein
LSSSGSPIHPGDSVTPAFGFDCLVFQLPAQQPHADTTHCGSASKGAHEIPDGRVAARGPTGDHAFMTAFTGDLEHIIGYSIR